jgi:dipeptidase E
MQTNILTSGFPHGFTKAFITAVEQALDRRDRFVFVASDFRVHDRTAYYMDRFLGMFREQGIVFGEAHIVDFECTSEQARAWIAEADLVWLAGGPTLTQIAHIRSYGLIDSLRQRDGLTVGMSAGSINMARRVVYARDVREEVMETAIYEGIGLVEVNIEPHLNEADEEHLADIREASCIAPIYGLHDDAFFVVRDGKIAKCGTYKLFDERSVR